MIQLIKIDNINKSDRARLDKYLLEKYPERTRSSIKNLIDSEKILVNEKKVKSGYEISNGDVISINFPSQIPTNALPQDIKLDIIYQDEDLVVVNKPQGMVVHPAVKNYDNTLVNALLFQIKDLSGINGELRPGIVHRIDKDTSGLLVVAKNDFAHVELSKQIANKTCKRFYFALVDGYVKEQNGEIITQVGRDKKNRLKMSVLPSNEGKVADTIFKVVKYYSGYTLLEFELKTGRTHQIRVHCEYMHHSIVGDRLYNRNKCKFKLEGQLLHAYKLQFIHPRTGELMSFEIPLPKYFQNILSELTEI